MIGIYGRFNTTNICGNCNGTGLDASREACRECWGKQVFPKKIICWWSGGVTSAVACFIASQIYGKDNCRFIFIDTKNEDDDTYRFKKDCERWYGKEIETLTNEKYTCIQDVWRKYKSLNVATGAICSSELKRAVRLKFEKENEFDYQVFGFDIDEPKRAKSLKANYERAKPIFTLLMFGYSKLDCFEVLGKAGIEIPKMYQLGYHNNNCFKTKCIQGGFGYWQKVEVEDTPAFDAMADMEWELSELAGKPVTMLKDQSKAAKESGNWQVFLKKHPKYPHLKCLADFPKREVKPLGDCNGMCGTRDFEKRSETELEINFEPQD